MNFEEHAAKPLLQAAGIATSRGRLARSAAEAEAAAAALGVPVVVKAQVPTGRRGKAGGIQTAEHPEAAREAAQEILGMEIAGHRVETVLIEERAAVVAEYYAAVLNDAASKGPLVMFSPEGGIDIEEIAESKPDRLRQVPVDIMHGFDLAAARALLDGLGLGSDEEPLAETLVRLYRAYRENDAELLEVNPLARLADGRLVALDCKFVLDDSGAQRREELVGRGSPEPLTALEARGKGFGLRYIELDGDIGVLANGAGLTMTTMDVITHHGGRPANFLEIGGAAYTKARPALELVLDNPNVRCLLVNFCGAFARTDVMTGGLLDAWEALKPTVPVFFSVRGTGSAEAQAMLRERLGVTPFETMDGAIVAAIEAARDAGTAS
ncbi:MAG: acetate--CoA ligase family protein [Rhodospirillales bacterium]|nr:acetate--CoA ligase family protein [Rhodospirillales bacterium]